MSDAGIDDGRCNGDDPSADPPEKEEERRKDESSTMGLDDLFTNTEYETVSMVVPCFSSEDDGGDALEPPDGEDGADRDRRRDRREAEKDECYDGIVVSLSCSPSASTDFDLTGQILWPVSILLGQYLASSRGRSLLRGATVVEIGSGCGFAGLTAAHFCDRAVLTDGSDAVVELLGTNCAGFRRRFVRGRRLAAATNPEEVAAAPDRRGDVVVSARKLLWGDRSDLLSTVSSAGGHVDCVIAADVVQWPAVVEPLLRTVKALLWTSRSSRPTLVLGLVERAATTSELFFEWAERLGFVWERAECATFLEGGIVPERCRETGRKTEVYEVVLADRTEAPVLLGEGAEDRTVGDGFEHTTSMPC